MNFELIIENCFFIDSVDSSAERLVFDFTYFLTLHVLVLLHVKALKRFFCVKNILPLSVFYKKNNEK